MGGCRAARWRHQRDRLPAAARARGGGGRGPGAAGRCAGGSRHIRARADRAARRAPDNDRCASQRDRSVRRRRPGRQVDVARPAARRADDATDVVGGAAGGGRLPGSREPARARADRERRPADRSTDARVGVRQRALPAPRRGRLHQPGVGHDYADALKPARRRLPPASRRPGRRAARGGRAPRQF